MESGTGTSQDMGLFDWGHAEAPFFINGPIWDIRAGMFASRDVPLPVVQPPAEGWAGFWDRFTFTQDATMSFADSNLHAGALRPRTGPRPGFGSVVLFDAHHDSG